MNVENAQSENAEAARSGASERERSTIQFPYMNLADAAAMAHTLHENVGQGDASEDQLAAWMDLSPKSSGFRVRVATTRMFGLIDGGSDGLHLSELGRAVVDPHQKRRALVEAFLNVPLYKLVFENYKGGIVPPAAAFERDIKSWGVASKQASRARQALERSAEEAGFYESGRNRLVKPAVKDGEKEILDDKPDKRNGSGGGNLPPDLDPIIRGLIDRLPPSGSVWPAEERELWLSILKASFQLVYKDKDPKGHTPDKRALDLGGDDGSELV